MVNPEHFNILKQGVNVWNEWRKKNPEIKPDLSHAKLYSGDSTYHTPSSKAEHYFWEATIGRFYIPAIRLPFINLSYTNLSDTKLSNADISYADLSYANLCNVDLSSAELVKTDLSNAELFNANLSYANLSNANLSNADLGRANLSNANLSNADLHKARLHKTLFVDIDLSQVKNLDLCVHLSSSSIDQQTFINSGKLPKIFLRGCGLSDEFIQYIPSLFWTDKALEFYSCFISYSSKDEEFAKRLHADLQDNGVRCWFAPEDLKIGDKIRPTIDESIRIYDKLLLILTEHSIKSDWVEKEVETAFEKEQQKRKTVLFPIRLDSIVMETNQAWAADIRRTRHIGDFCDWKNYDSYRKAFNSLLRDLQAESISQ